jgi:acetyl esterase/lipase
MAASENQMAGALCLLNGSERTVWKDVANPAHMLPASKNDCMVPASAPAIPLCKPADLGIYRGTNKIIAIGCVFLMTILGNHALAYGSSVSAPIPLWPNGVPDEKGNVGEEHDTTMADGDLVAGKRVIRLTNVSQPTITLYRPSKGNANGTAVVVCPGGGYSILAMDLEGTEICKWLNSIGVTGVLLKYRVPQRPGDEIHKLPLQDAQRALGLVRFDAKEWNLDPKRIGVLGFSAGGHLNVNLSNNFDQRAYEVVDDADQVSCRPDFSMPIYPAYLVLKNQNSQLAPELKVTTNTPPTCLIQTEDDAIQVENSLVYYKALKNAGVPVEMHLYSDGGHGYGLRPSGKLVSSWPKRAEDWMRGLGLLERKNN